MKKLLITTWILIFTLSSCLNEEETLPIENNWVEIEEMSSVQHDIVINILANKFGGYVKGQSQTRSLSSFTLTPYVENGDTLLYIAQYSDGWEIYSANHGAGMLVFSSNKGVFNLNDPNMPDAVRDLVVANADAVRSISKEKDVEINTSWGPFAMTEEDFSNGLITVNDLTGSKAISYPEVPSGKWILLKYETISDETEYSPKLIKTEWNQRNPWNLYSKNVQDTTGNIVRGYAGCAPIAVSQYMYYTHFLNNIPLYTISKATPIQNGNDYTFSGQSSSIWNDMAISTWSMSGINEAAMFIGHVGRSLMADYNAKGTEVRIATALNYLSTVYNTNFSQTDFSLSYITESIDQLYPVISNAWTNKKSNGESQDEAGHAFIIDQYKKNTKKVKYYYGIERDPWTGPGPDPYKSDMVDENGNILVYAYTDEIVKTETYYGISMNWGYSAYYNTLYYSPWTTDWSAGGHIFNLDHKIYKRDDIK